MARLLIDRVSEINDIEKLLLIAVLVKLEDNAKQITEVLSEQQ